MQIALILARVVYKSLLYEWINGEFTPFLLLNILDIVELKPHLII